MQEKNFEFTFLLSFKKGTKRNCCDIIIYMTLCIYIDSKIGTCGFWGSKEDERVLMEKECGVEGFSCHLSCLCNIMIYLFVAEA